MLATCALGLNWTDLQGEPGAGAAEFFWFNVMLVVLMVAVLLDAEAAPLVFLVSTTICFWPLLIPFLGVTVSNIGRSEAPASTDRGTLIVWRVWLPSGPAMGTWMEIRSELADLAGLGVGGGAGLAWGWESVFRILGGGLDVYCLGGIGVRFCNNGLIGGDLRGGLRTEVGGSSDTGIGVVGRVGRWMGEEKVGLGGRRISGGFLSGKFL